VRYFFHIADGNSEFKDEEGQDFLSPQAARAHAATVARELAADAKDNLSFTVYVMDENGNKIAQVPVVGPYD
jgi:hypothetical protein